MKSKVTQIRFSLLIPSLFLFLLSISFSAPKVGYTLDFDKLHSVTQAKQLLNAAHKSGARVINIIPPAHIWENKTSKAILDAFFEESQKLKMDILITRIDADYPNGKNYLYDSVLTKPGALPGEVTRGKRPYLATVGNTAYEDWMQEETEFYSREYGAKPNLIGFNVGFFADPFVVKTGSLLFEDNKTKRYEIAQYTSFAKALWQHWLVQKLGTLDRINQEYQTKFTSIAEIPLPLNEEDKHFELSTRAYTDFITCISEWVIGNYKINQTLWHQHSQSPFIFELDVWTSDRFANGRGAYTAFDFSKWFR